MKHLLLILAISLLFVGCKTTKRIVQTETHTQQTAAVDRAVQVTEKAKTQADKKVVEETTETTVEYYPPLVNSLVPLDSVHPTIQDKGPVKSVTTKKVMRKEVDQGTVETEKTGIDNTKATTTTKMDQQTKQKEVTKTNYTTLLIIFGVGVAAGIFVYLKWSKIKPFLLPILSIFKGYNK